MHKICPILLCAILSLTIGVSTASAAIIHVPSITVNGATVEQAAYGPVAIYTTPDTITAPYGTPIAVEVWIESGGHALDTAQVFLSYDVSKVWAYNIVADNGALYLLHSAWSNTTGIVALLAAGKAWIEPPTLSGIVGTRFRIATVYFAAIADVTDAALRVVRQKPLMLSGIWYRGILMCDTPPYPPDWMQEEPPC